MKNRKIAGKILVPLTITLIGLFIVVMGGILWFDAKHISSSVNEQFASTETMWSIEVEEDSAFMKSTIN